MTIDTDRDRVRILIGDTDSADPLIPDDQIAEFLTQRTMLDSTGGTLGVNVPAAAADAAGAISAKFARQFDFAEDGQNFRASQRAAHYQMLERTLRARSGGSSQQVTLAGTEST